MGALADSYLYLEKQIPTIVQTDSGPFNITAIVEDRFDKDTISNESVITDIEADNTEKFDTVDINVSFERSLSLRSTISKQMSSSYNDLYESRNNEPPKFTSQLESYPSMGLDDGENTLRSSSTINTRTQVDENDNIQVKTIQTFSFCSFEINVDTLVRLFIIA